MVCWLLLFTKLSTTYGGSEQELWHTNNFVVTYGQSHALLNSTIWALFTHHHIFVHFFLYHTAVFICFVSWSLCCWFGLCVQSYNMTCNLLWTRQEVTACILHTRTKLYSLLSPDISQVVTWFTQREPNYNCLPFSQPNKSLQSASSEQEPSCGSWTPGRYL